MPIKLSAPEINVTLGAGDSCTNTVCKGDFKETSEMSALYYSVSVFAKNLLMDGYSEEKICSNRMSKANIYYVYDLHLLYFWFS